MGANLLGLMDIGPDQGHKYEIVFHLKLTLTAAQVYSLRDRAAEDKVEHDAVMFVRLPGPEVPLAQEQRCRSSFDGVEGLDIPTLSSDDFLSGEYLLTDVSNRVLRIPLRLKTQEGSTSGREPQPDGGQADE